MDEIYNEFLKIYLPDENLKKANKETINKYKDILPKEITNLWRKYGFGNYRYGLIKIINPDIYINYFKLLFNDEDYIPFLMDSFGNTFYIKKNNPTIYVLNIEFSFIDICQYSFKDFLNCLINENFVKTFLFKNTFDEALVSGLIPNNNEILVFNPPILFGGKRRIDDLIIKDTIKYFNFIIPILAMNGIQNKVTSN